jgi:hypothetical protein
MRPGPAARRGLLLALLWTRTAVAETPPAPGVPGRARLVQELLALRQDHDRLADRLRGLMAQVSERLTGYLDAGAFWVQGDGTGIRTDTGHKRLPEFQDVPHSWVFLGDPLATAVNSRGEPAHTGESRAVTFNPIGNGGVASVLLNALNVTLATGLGPSLTVTAMADLVPRSRDVANPRGLFVGDFLDLKLAYAEYQLPTERLDLRLAAGKFDSVLGIEYRSQESPDRIGVTPSLICRYTCGRPIGVKARARLFDDLLVLAAALTNGGHMIEGFPFSAEVDTNFFKTVAGRISSKLPVGAGLELGFSGSFGAQDFQPGEDVHQWHYGFDAHLEIRDLDVRAEFVQGRAIGAGEAGDGAACDLVPCLRYMGAYGQIAYRALNWLTPYARADWRSAFHRSGASFVYVSELVRATAGLRFELGPSVVIKAEYTLIRELGPVPEFPDDVLTSSLVARY